MIRQRQRRTIEELYGSKLDAAKSEVAATHQSIVPKGGRITERGYHYTISNGPAPAVSTVPGSIPSKSLNSGKETARRRTARNSNKISNGKHCVKEPIAIDNGRRSPAQATKGEKHIHTNVYDNKMYGNQKEMLADVAPHHQYQHQPHQHHHNHQNHQNQNHNDEDKDNDSDEFFDLIRRTVESAIGKSISELLNRNFRELSSKVERFSAELKSTNSMLYRMQNELNNKIGHYGEENTRHFRYLCMKSEYDKMFYQHQTFVANAKPPIVDSSCETKNTERRKISPKNSKSAMKIQHKESDKTNSAAACSYRTMKSKQRSSEMKDSRTSSSGDISQKSSEVGIREVLQHIQKFCTQMQFSDFKCDRSSEDAGASHQRNGMSHEDLLKVDEEVFEHNEDADEEDEVWEVSSDGMTPRNRSNDSRKYGGSTTRGDVTQRGSVGGAGDG